MKICIVTPSDEFGASAGMRIRYDRLKVGAAISDSEISALPINGFTSKAQFVHDAYIFAKTFTPHSYLLAHRMRQAGKVVGVDIFDDYFSQPWDPRMLRYRTWLSTIASIVDFVICSTPRLRDAILPLLPRIPLAVIPDPSDSFDPRLVARLFDRKIDEMTRLHEIRVMWFGIGDNPYFPVGIRDLVAFGSELAGLRESGWTAHLLVLTNKRALSPEGLSLLSRLPVPVLIEEWSPERERVELLRSHVCFLPVNGQAFSRAKSLNRAISALVSGCQLLCNGYPLYDEISDFAYSKAADLLADLDRGQPAARGQTVPALTKHLSELANPYSGAEDLIALLTELAESRPCKRPASNALMASQLGISAIQTTGFPPDMGVIHGATTEQSVHKLVQRLGGLSVKSPLSRSDWNFHVRFDATDEGTVRVLVAENVFELVTGELRKELVPFGRVLAQTFFALPDDVGLREFAFGGVRSIRTRSLVPDLTAAPRVMSAALHACKRLFPEISFYISEQNSLFARIVAANT